MKLSFKTFLSTKQDFFLLFFMVGIYPFLVIPGPLNYFTGPRYIVLVIISLLSFYSLFLNGRFKWGLVYVSLGFFVIFSAISTIMAEDLMKAIIGNFHRFTGFSTYLFCIFLFFLAFQYKTADKILKYMIISASLVSLIGLL